MTKPPRMKAAEPKAIKFWSLVYARGILNDDRENPARRLFAVLSIDHAGSRLDAATEGTKDHKRLASAREVLRKVGEDSRENLWFRGQVRATEDRLRYKFGPL